MLIVFKASSKLFMGVVLIYKRHPETVEYKCWSVYIYPKANTIKDTTKPFLLSALFFYIMSVHISDMS